MVSPFAFFSERQREELEKIQKFTQNMTYMIHTDNNKVEITLNTEDADAMQLLPQLLEGIVTSTSQMLYQMFGMKGRRV